jgi:DNA-3-methyladenine glycosylase I
MTAAGLTRCPWTGIADPLYARYHDEEWGVPKTDDRAMFEKLVLEGFQAGLSWLTILRKRENFRKAFHRFDAARIARYGAKDIARLMADPGIVRNRLKVEATIDNARARSCGISSTAVRRSTRFARSRTCLPTRRRPKPSPRR